MSILGLQPEVPQVPQGPVGQILTHEGYAKIALVDLGREASDALRASWPAACPFQSAGVIESTWLPPLLGAGSTAASSLLAGNVFLATVNPQTLMTIGTGVGSAVMGSTGVVAQAPFVAAALSSVYARHHARKSYAQQRRRGPVGSAYSSRINTLAGCQVFCRRRFDHRRGDS